MAEVVVQTEIPNSANAITAVSAGPRKDPEGVAPEGNVTLITWKDSRGADRTLTLGAYLYQYDFSFDDHQQVIKRTANDKAFGHPGFGYVVSHSQNGNSPLGKSNVPTKVETTIFAGGHHAIHRIELVYDRNLEDGGNGIKIPVVIEWLIATGRDHPVWAVTWKMSEVANPSNIDFDEYRMDVRGPYGSLNFDGAATRELGDDIGGVAWGDCGFKFITTDPAPDAKLTFQSPWTYNTPNTVNFTQAWTAKENAEMGIVQTRALDPEMGMPDRVKDCERGHTSQENYPGKGSCGDWGNVPGSVMPCVNGWPFQLMNYDWGPGGGKAVNESNNDKLIAWGSPYGWLGAFSFEAMDGTTHDGRGDRSYATFIVLGPHYRFSSSDERDLTEGDVAGAVRDIEALAAATISNVTPGSLVTEVEKGPGTTEKKNIVNGYNDTYAAFYLSAIENQLMFTFTPADDKPVKNPIFMVQNYTAGQFPKISVNGVAITVNTGPDSGAFVSINIKTRELWVTLNSTVGTTAVVQILPPVGGGSPPKEPGVTPSVLSSTSNPAAMPSKQHLGETTMANGNNNHLKWSTEVWQRINKVVHDEAAAIRRARRDEGSTLPELHSGRVFTLFGQPNDYVNTVVGHKVGVTKEKRLSIHAGQENVLVPIKMWVEFQLDQPQFNDENVTTALATKAAYLLALAEEYIILLGANAAPFLERMNVFYDDRDLEAQVGLLGQGKKQVDKPVLDSINDGIKELRERSHHGDYCAIVSPDLFREAYAPRNNTTDAPIYEIRPLLRKAGFLYSPAATGKTGVIFSLGGGTLDMAVPVDIRVEPDPEERGLAILRVVEQFRLRVNDETAVVSLGEREAAVQPIKEAGKGA